MACWASTAFLSRIASKMARWDTSVWSYSVSRTALANTRTPSVITGTRLDITVLWLHAAIWAWNWESFSA